VLEERVGIGLRPLGDGVAHRRVEGEAPRKRLLDQAKALSVASAAGARAPARESSARDVAPM
jgi:hypothetical protein